MERPQEPKHVGRDAEPHRQTRQKLSDSGKTLQSKINDYWVYEILSWVGSLGALLAIVDVLLANDKKSLPDLPWGITINSVLSWLSQIYNALTLATVASCIGQSKWVAFSHSWKKLVDFNSFGSASSGVLGSVAFLRSATHLKLVSFLRALLLGLTIPDSMSRLGL